MEDDIRDLEQDQVAEGEDKMIEFIRVDENGGYSSGRMATFEEYEVLYDWEAEVSAVTTSRLVSFTLVPYRF